MFLRRHSFTIIEILFIVVIIAILLSLLLPAFMTSTAKARFVRWLQFNKQCSTDPACVINLNFQEGEGTNLKNSAQGHQVENFRASDYNGIIKGDYEWGQGRWWKGKKALCFNGIDTYVEFPLMRHINFGRGDDFTIVVWVKFDELRKWDGIFSKSYWSSPPHGYAQYDMYFDGTVYSDKTAAGQFEVDVSCKCIGFDDVGENGEKNIKLDTENWFQLTLRNKFIGEKQEVNVFFNGIKLQSRDTNFFVSTKDKCAACLAIGCIRWLVRTTNPQTGQSEPSKEGELSNFFKGKIDEFLIYNRALTDSEIRAHHTMGAEHL